MRPFPIIATAAMQALGLTLGAAAIVTHWQTIAAHALEIERMNAAHFAEAAMQKAICAPSPAPACPTPEIKETVRTVVVPSSAPKCPPPPPAPAPNICAIIAGLFQ